MAKNDKVYATIENHRFNIAYNYILDNFQNELYLDVVAEKCCMSKFAFCRYFKKRTGLTFSSFVNEVRLDYACNILLKNADLPIQEIAYASGFNCPSYFNRTFKAFKGFTPKTYGKERIDSEHTAS